MNELEDQSCRNSCKGVLSQPKEVFLMGCNTLADKSKDHRTPEQYLAVLLEDDIPRSEAERIVEARYGSLGDSFRDRMKRVFSGVPKLYGFDSVGPSGKNVKPFLEKYFTKIPNYEKHLEIVEAERLVLQVQDGNEILKKFNRNEPLQSVLKSTAFYQCPGVFPGEPGYELKKSICDLYDKKKPAAERVALMRKMLESPDRMLFLPSISAFAAGPGSSIAHGADVKKEIELIRKNGELRADIEKTKNSLKKNPVLSIDIARLESFIGWLSEEDVEKEIRSHLREPMKNLSRENIDLICSLATGGGMKMDISLEDFNPEQLENPELAGVMACLGTEDKKITERVVKSLEKAKREQVPNLLSALHGLPGENEKIAAFAKKNIVYSEDSTSMMAKLIYLDRGTDEIEKETILLYSLRTDDPNFTLLVSNSSVKTDDLAWEIFDAKSLSYADESWMRSIFLQALPQDSKIIPKLLREAENRSKEWKEAVLAGAVNQDLSQVEVPDWVVKDSLSGNFKGLGMKLLLEGKLSAQQYEDIAKAVPGASEDDKFVLERVLKRKP